MIDDKKYNNLSLAGLFARKPGQSSLTSGLLGNTDALIGLGLLQGAAQGKDLFSAGMPAITQAAKIKKLLTPKVRSNFIQLTNEQKKSKGLPLDKQFQLDTANNKISQIGGSGTTVNVGANNKFRIKATKKEKKMLGYNPMDDIVVTKNKQGTIIADDVRSSLDSRLGKIGKAVTDSKLLDADLALRDIEDYISSLDKNGKRNLPGVGNIQGYAPDFITSKEGLKLRGLIAKYENIGLKKRSGAAVTPSEMTRFQNELAGSQKTADESVFRDILRKNRESIERQKKNTFALYRPEDLNAYWKSGGLDYMNKGSSSAQTTTDLSKLTTEQLQLLLKQGF